MSSDTNAAVVQEYIDAVNANDIEREMVVLADDVALHTPIPGLGQGDQDGRLPFASIKVSRALAKTVTYEAVTGVSEFGVNYFFIGNVTAAAGLTAFSIVIAPLVYFVHEKVWDYYDATKSRSPTAPAQEPLPAA